MISAVTGPTKPVQMQLDPLSRNVFEALSESDDNPVWKAFVHFICNRNPDNASALSQWSDRTVAAVTDALASVEQMRASAADFPQLIQAVAASFSDLEGDFFEYIVSGQQSETLLIVSYGRMRTLTAVASAFSAIADTSVEHSFAGWLSEDTLGVSSGPNGTIRDVLFVTKFNGLYLIGSNRAASLAGPYLSLDTCLAHTRSYIRRSRTTLISITYAETIPAAFIEDVVTNSCPIIGTRFTLNGTLCARSDDTPYVEVDF